MSTAPDHAFVLAAGLGTRLRPYTDNLPKPLVPLLGRPLLDYIFDHLKEAGVNRITVNLHHKPEPLRDFLASRSDLHITQSFEEELLDTGGGVRKALHTLGHKPFFMINGDAFWIGPALQQLTNEFDESRMDILLLLQPVDKMLLTEGVGDYDVVDGSPVRNPNKTGAYMFAGIRLCRPEILQDQPAAKFSFLPLMDEAQSKGRLHAVIYDHDWHHISTPQDLQTVENALKEADA